MCLEQGLVQGFNPRFRHFTTCQSRWFNYIVLGKRENYPAPAFPFERIPGGTQGKSAKKHRLRHQSFFYGLGVEVPSRLFAYKAIHPVESDERLGA